MPKWRVLVIDDDPDILELIDMSLGESHDVAAVESGLKAVEIVEEFEPDLIILDIMMPKVTGYQIIEALKERKDFSHIPVIFLSAKDTIRDQRYGYKLGATTYLTKPFQPDRLLRNINSIFEHTPPERKTKKHSLRKARELVQAIASGELPEEKPEKPKAPHSQTVHHREAETPEDSIWRG